MYNCINVVLCGDDYKLLEAALTAPKHISKYSSVRRVFFYSGELLRYELPFAITKAYDGGSSVFFSYVEIASHLAESTEDAVFFTSLQHDFHELYPSYIASFFRHNMNKCCIVGEDFPQSISGSAVQLKDLKIVGLDPLLGDGMFMDMLARLTAEKDSYICMNEISMHKYFTFAPETSQNVSVPINPGAISEQKSSRQMLIEQYGISRWEYIDGKLRLEFGNGYTDVLLLTVRLESIYEQNGIITMRGNCNFTFPDNCCVFAHYNGEIYKQVEGTNGSVLSQNAFKLNIPFSTPGDIGLYARITGVGDIPMAIGYAPSSRMRNRLGSFVLGESVLLTDTKKNQIRADSTSSNTLREIMEARLLKKPPHENEEIIRTYLTTYAFIEKDSILKELT